MISQISKKQIVLFFILLLFIFIGIFVFTNKSVEPAAIKHASIKTETKTKTDTKKENKTLKSEQKTLKIDLTGKDEPFVYTEHRTKIDQAIKENNKINTSQQEKDTNKNKEDWKVDYGVSLEDGAIEDIKNDHTIKNEMIKGKIGFSKSF